MSARPLLTVAIPTWNRAAYVECSLTRLASELREVRQGLVEVIVSDNCSPDATPEVVERAIASGMPIRYIRNDSNLGWALNFAQSFELARGKYVLLMGDDDLFVDGALPLLLARLNGGDYGVVCLRPYGFESDSRGEHPGGGGREREYRDANRFLIATSRYFTLTSACVVNKSLLAGVDSRQFCSTDLAAFHFVLRAALAAERNLYIAKYLIASKRQNSFSYEYAEVFVNQMWRIIDAHVAHGLTRATVRRLERIKMLSYYPFYLFDLRVSGRGNLQFTHELFARRFGGRWLFTCWLLPIIRLPRPMAIVWGAVAMVLGRIIDGQLRRGFMFAWSRLRRAWPSRRSTQTGRDEATQS